MTNATGLTSLRPFLSHTPPSCFVKLEPLPIAHRLGCTFPATVRAVSDTNTGAATKTSPFVDVASYVY